MCGRYALALRPSQVRRMLEDDGLPVYDAPPDGYESDEASGGGGGEEDNTHHARRAAGPAPRQSYNFAPGYFGIVYRADTPDWGAGPARTHGKKATTARDDKGQGAERAEEEQQATP
ncbi:hypothetical protein VTK73DRAFT_5015 [Phialemonium thermophilum]|uniref:SOS response associated peptidase (SRAP) n=1 Tax=Phialemonium thermophilum TaxID=223376 RepID=A0ABR3V494_9PEZI